MFASRFRYLVALGPLAGSLAGAAVAQPNIRPRVVVSWGPNQTPVNETAVAASCCNEADELVAMWMIGNGEDLGYAVSHNGGQTWDDRGQMPIPGDCSAGSRIDPTVAVDLDTGDFVGGGAIVCPCEPQGMQPPYHVFLGHKPCAASNFAYLDPNDPNNPLDNGEEGCCIADFPHIASGPGPLGQDTHFYVTSHTGLPDECPFGLLMHRSTDGGPTWTARTRITDEGNFAVPAVASDETLYVAYNAPGRYLGLIESADGGRDVFRARQLRAA